MALLQLNSITHTYTMRRVGWVKCRAKKGTDPLFEQKGWCQFPGSFELNFLRENKKVL